MKITMDFARQDDCLDRMVPSDLRVLVSEIDQYRMAAEAEAKRGDELADRVERLDKAARELLCNLSGYHHTIDSINIKDDLREALGEKRAASLLLHDAGVLEKVVEDRVSLLTDLVTGAIDNARVYASKHGSISLAALRFIAAELRKQAAEQESKS
jgi:hypothetical protein